MNLPIDLHQDIPRVTGQHEEHANVTRCNISFLGSKKDDKAWEGQYQRSDDPDVSLAGAIGEPGPDKDKDSAEDPRRSSKEEGLSRSKAKGLDNYNV